MQERSGVSESLISKFCLPNHFISSKPDDANYFAVENYLIFDLALIFDAIASIDSQLHAPLLPFGQYEWRAIGFVLTY